MTDDFTYQLLNPNESLTDFVESFWCLQNNSDKDKEIVVLPDGRLELIFSLSPTQPFHIMLSGLETYPEQVILQANTLMYAVSFKLPAVEYIFKNTIASILDSAQLLPVDFWDFNVDDMLDFTLFCKKASQKIQSLLPKETDGRKIQLFNHIYTSKGSLSVKELSEKVFWSSRQINRYFQQQYGISLKAYNNILRFRASLTHLSKGKLYPESHFSDQSHFIKEIKKFSGVVPKELLKNKNDL